MYEHFLAIVFAVIFYGGIIAAVAVLGWTVSEVML